MHKPPITKESEVDNMMTYTVTFMNKKGKVKTKSVKQDLIVTFCFKYLDYNRNIRNNQIEKAKKIMAMIQLNRILAFLRSLASSMLALNLPRMRWS